MRERAGILRTTSPSNASARVYESRTCNPFQSFFAPSDSLVLRLADHLRGCLCSRVKQAENRLGRPHWPLALIWSRAPFRRRACLTSACPSSGDLARRITSSSDATHVSSARPSTVFPYLQSPSLAFEGIYILVPSAPLYAARAQESTSLSLLLPARPRQDERLRYVDMQSLCLLVTHDPSEEYLLRLLDEDGGVPAHLNAAALKALDEALVPDAPGTGGDEALERKWRETHPLLPTPKTGFWEEYRLKDVKEEFERTVDYALLGPGYRWPSQGIYRGRISQYLRDPRTQKIRPYTDAEIGDEFRRRKLIEVEIQRRTPKKVDRACAASPSCTIPLIYAQYVLFWNRPTRRYMPTTTSTLTRSPGARPLRNPTTRTPRRAGRPSSC